MRNQAKLVFIKILLLDLTSIVMTSCHSLGTRTIRSELIIEIDIGNLCKRTH